MELAFKLVLLWFIVPNISAFNNKIEIAYLSKTAEVGLKEAMENWIREENSTMRFHPVGYHFRNMDSFNITSTVCLALSQHPICVLSEVGGEAVCSIAEAKGIPCFMITETDMTFTQNGDYSCSISFYPDLHSLTQAYSQVVGGMGWRSVTLLYEDPKRMRELKLALFNTVPNVEVIKLPKGNDYRSVLKRVKESGEKEIILDSSSDNVYQILGEATRMEMMNDYSYFITSLDLRIPPFNEILTEGANIIALRMVDPSAAEKFHTAPIRNLNITSDLYPAYLAVAYDASMSFIRSLNNLMAKETVTEPSPMNCFDQEKWKFGPKIVNEMKNEESEGFTGRVKFDETGRRIDYKLDVVNIKASGVTKLGEWTEKEGAKFSPHYERGPDTDGAPLWNRTVVVTTVLNAPYVSKKHDSESDIGDEGLLEGFSIDVIKELSKMLSFNYKIMLTHDGKYGSYNKRTKEWNGMIADILNEKADMAISDLTITSERQRVIDFTVPIMNIGVSILYIKPISQMSDFFLFLQPWSTKLWMCTGIAAAAMAILMYILTKLSPYERQCFNGNEQENNLSFGNSFWFIIGTGTQQGSNIIPRALSTRIASGFWCFFVMIMVSLYVANLTAILTTKNMASPIQSVEDLERQSSVKYGCVRGGATSQFFKDSDYFTYQRVWSTMESDPSVFTNSVVEGVQRVSDAKGKYAFFMESTSIEYITKRHCDLTQVGGLLNSKGVGIALPKNSLQRAQINTALLKMQEIGKLQALKNKWWKQKNDEKVCIGSTLGGSQEIVMSNVDSLFITLIGGMIISCIVALIEFTWNNLRLTKNLPSN